MRYKVRIAPEALLDAAIAHAHIAKDSVAAADHWFDGLVEATESLCLHPRRCARAVESGRFKREVRQLLYKSHRVLFSITDDEVRVLFVHHTARKPRRPGT